MDIYIYIYIYIYVPIYTYTFACIAFWLFSREEEKSDDLSRRLAKVSLLLLCYSRA